MAWTAPATWSVSEIVTASKMNTHVRDNLKYLKGQAGAVSLEDNLGVVDTTPSSDWTPTTQYLTVATAASPGSAGVAIKGARSGSDNAFAVLYGVNLSATGSDKTGGGISFNRDGAADSANMTFLTRNAGTVAERMRIDKAGNTGIGITPTGKLHVFGASSGGAIFFDSNSVAGSAVQVLAAGGMQKGGVVMAFSQSTDNLASGFLPLIAGSSFIAVGGSTNDYKIVDSSPDFCVIRVLTNGTVQLIRTGGSKTYRVALWLVYW